MSWLRKIFFSFLGKMAYRMAFNSLKKKAILIYLKTLQATRRSLMVAIFVFMILQLVVFGFIGASVTAIWLLPIEDLNTKLYVLLGFFGFILVVPLAAICYVLSERFWFQMSGAEKLLQDAS